MSSSTGCAASAELLCDTPRLAGSFVQPYLAASWSQAQWEEEFGYLDEAGIEELILQWTADTGEMSATYPTQLEGFSEPATSDMVGSSLDSAQKSGAGVYLGLQNNDEWWDHYAEDLDWIEQESEYSQQIASDLWELYGEHPAMKGWYLPFEVDNWHHTTRASWDNLSGYYADVTHHLQEISPDKPVIVAPFFNTSGGLEAEEWAQMWVEVLPDNGIDAIAVQDGVGVEQAEVDDLAEWYRALEDAIEDNGLDVELWATTETFVRGTADDEFLPAETEAFTESMCAVQPMVSRYWSFSYSHYQSPQQSDPVYHRSYLDYLGEETDAEGS